MNITPASIAEIKKYAIKVELDEHDLKMLERLDEFTFAKLIKRTYDPYVRARCAKYFADNTHLRIS